MLSQMDGERDGLPTDPNRRPRTFAKEAAALVSLHKWKVRAQEGAQARHAAQQAHAAHQHHGHHGHGTAHIDKGDGKDQRGGSRAHRRLTPAASHNAAAREAKESGASHMAPVVGGGVLSNLLRLYDGQQDRGSSTTLADYSDDESGTPSPALHRGFFHRPNPSQSSFFPPHAPRHRQTTDSVEPPRRTQTESSRRVGHKTPPLELLAKGATDAGRSVAQGAAGASKYAYKGVKTMTDQVGDRIEAGDRPAAARSGAGVFGALQASAMGLTGVAAPAAAAIAPNPEKSGFRIARYRPHKGSADRHHHSSPVSQATTPTIESPPNLRPGPLTTSASADNVLNLVHQHSSDSTAVSHGNGRPASIAGDAVETAPAHRLEPTSGLPSGATTPTGTHRSGQHLNLKALHDRFDPRKFHDAAGLKGRRSGLSTPLTPGTPEDELKGSLEKATPKHGGHMRKRKDKRRQEEIFITMHIAAVLQRQEFVIMLSRSLMMFGGPCT